MSSLPGKPPTQAGQDAADALEMALAQRGMMWFFLLKLATDVTVGIAVKMDSRLLLVLYFVVYVLVQAWIAINAFRLGRVIYGAGPGLACALVVLPPGIGTMAVLILNGNTMDRLRKLGVKSGIMGVARRQLEELRRQVDKFAVGPENRDFLEIPDELEHEG